MTSRISIENISIKNNQGSFLDPIEWEITFSNTTPLKDSLEWKIIYFGSANDQSCDQILEEFQIPPIEAVETMKFQLESQPPVLSKIPRQELLCVTAMILTVSYKNQQFIRVGYYIHYQYIGQQMLEGSNLLSVEQIVRKTRRTILDDKPRVTKFNIKWEDQPTLSETKEDKMSIIKGQNRPDNTEQEESMRSVFGQKALALQEIRNQQKLQKFQSQVPKEPRETCETPIECQ